LIKQSKNDDSPGHLNGETASPAARWTVGPQANAAMCNCQNGDVVFFGGESRKNEKSNWKVGVNIMELPSWNHSFIFVGLYLLEGCYTENND
jgi:hypothetical protein